MCTIYDRFSDSEDTQGHLRFTEAATSVEYTPLSDAQANVAMANNARSTYMLYEDVISADERKSTSWRTQMPSCMQFVPF